MLFGIGARGWGRVRRQRSRRRRTRSRARGRRTFVGFISPSSVGIVRGLTVLNSVRSSHAALPKGHGNSNDPTGRVGGLRQPALGVVSERGYLAAGIRRREPAVERIV